ncbi:Ltp family lipoprotein [Bifidobacterium bombi]|uniref:Host cell surface-exposed lipoprotein n=1 Tax=Bifidobacterium bombi DSM 19703 TaxID=1341695 RepID=A0A080N626_9BIFI|nr:Ltp family lipoprotein [Bifidobacterium bombi]KFF31214.1 host cell surface-exposed lipoprotein [Bifidobacterium bombi DSM 19703]
MSDPIQQPEDQTQSMQPEDGQDHNVQETREPAQVQPNVNQPVKSSSTKKKKPFYKRAWFWVIVVVFVLFCYAVSPGGDSGNSSKPSTSSQSSHQTSKPKAEAKLDSINVDYFGPKEDGEQITNDNKAVIVTAHYTDGSKKGVTGWTVVNPGALTFKNPQDFTVDYQGKQAKITLQANPPAEYQSALSKAQSYSTSMHMSKQGIYDQLTSQYGEKFTPEAAQYAVDNLKADYNANALVKAKDYQQQMSMSPAAIHDQLTSQYGEKFTQEEADYAVQHLNG